MSPSRIRKPSKDPAANFPNCPTIRNLTQDMQKADALLLLTELKDYRDFTPEVAAAAVHTSNTLDGRNVLDPAVWRAAGWNYSGSADHR